MGGKQDAVFFARIPDPRDQKNETGQGAHEEGVDDGAPHRDQALADGFLGLGRPVSHGFGPHARLVGKGGPAHAGHDDGTEDSTGDRFAGEGIGEDEEKAGQTASA